MSKTKIITIEGIDGSGKTVQFELLTKGLQDRGFTVQKRAYPVYDAFFGEQVGRFLSCSEGVSASTVDQKSMALWFAMDRFMDFRNYRDGEADFLLINRYVLSNAVYQSIRERDISEPGSDNSAFADWVFRLEYDVLGLPRPTLNLFFDVDTECAGKNVDKTVSVTISAAAAMFTRRVRAFRPAQEPNTAKCPNVFPTRSSFRAPKTVRCFLRKRYQTRFSSCCANAGSSDTPMLF